MGDTKRTAIVRLGSARIRRGVVRLKLIDGRVCKTKRRSPVYFLK